MPTSKKRINITDDVYGALMRLSAKRDQSVAGVGLSLIEEALEYQEDIHFSRIADDAPIPSSSASRFDTAFGERAGFA